MTTPTQTPAVASEKEALEIAKLKLETAKLAVETKKLNRERIIAPFALIAQVFSALCILATGVIVLYFFQRPQLTEMQNARTSNEQLQLENDVLAIQKFENDNDKMAALDALASQWPQYPFLTEIAHSAKVIVQTKHVAEDCKASGAQVTDLNASIKTLDERIAQPIRLGGFNLHFNDPVILAQKAALSAQVAVIQDKRRQSNCPAISP